MGEEKSAWRRLQVPVGSTILASSVSMLAGMLAKKGWAKTGWEVEWASFPCYLPEVGCLVSLETTAPGIAEDFVEKGEGVVLLRFTRFDSEWRRGITYGQYFFPKLGELADLYTISTLMGLMLSPSAPIGRGPDLPIVHPCRSFLAIRTLFPSFRCTYSYNLFLVFLDPTWKGKPKEIWLGKKVKAVTLRGKQVELKADGRTEDRNVYLLTEEGEEVERGYYLCVTESFNDFRGEGVPGRHLHLVRSLRPLVHSPYDLLPLVRPKVGLEVGVRVRFRVPKQALERILWRLGKFEPVGGGMEEEHWKLYLGLARVEKKGMEEIYEAVNPGLVAGLIRVALSELPYSERAKELLRSPSELMERVEEKDPGLTGAGKHLDAWGENFLVAEEGEWRR